MTPVSNPDLRVSLCGLELKNPIIAASGTFGYGIEFEEIVSLEETEKIQAATGEALCPNHAAQQMRIMLERIAEANIFYINVPYGAIGAFLWF